MNLSIFVVVVLGLLGVVHSEIQHSTETILGDKAIEEVEKGTTKTISSLENSNELANNQTVDTSTEIIIKRFRRNDNVAFIQSILEKNHGKGCKLTNDDLGEPMYCPSSTFSDNGDRTIFTWTSKRDDTDEYWDIQMNGDGIATLRNTYYNDRYLAYYPNQQKAVGAIVNNGNNKWKLEVADKAAIQIRIKTLDDRYLYSALEKQDSGRRFVRVTSNLRSRDSWRIECF